MSRFLRCCCCRCLLVLLYAALWIGKQTDLRTRQHWEDDKQNDWTNHQYWRFTSHSIISHRKQTILSRWLKYMPQWLKYRDNVLTILLFFFFFQILRFLSFIRFVSCTSKQSRTNHFSLSLFVGILFSWFFYFSLVSSILNKIFIAPCVCVPGALTPSKVNQIFWLMFASLILTKFINNSFNKKMYCFVSIQLKDQIGQIQFF